MVSKWVWIGAATTLWVATACGTSVKRAPGVSGSGGDAAGTNGDAGRAGGSPTGGASGTGGDGGRGGVGPQGGFGGGSVACVATPILEACEPFGAFYHDPDTNECLHTPAFNCAREPNAFLTLAECLAACPTAKPGLDACDGPRDCAVVATGCCGLCADAPIGYARSINAARQSDPSECDGVQCGPCAPVDELRSKTQNYISSCSLGRCMVEDLSYDQQIASCEADDDCHLRDGSDCCEQCDDMGFIAISSDSRLREQCPEEPCRTCEHHYAGYRARCLDGYCRVAPDDAGGAAGAGGTGDVPCGACDPAACPLSDVWIEHSATCCECRACPPGFVACDRGTALCLQTLPDTDGDGCCGCLNP